MRRLALLLVTLLCAGPAEAHIATAEMPVSVLVVAPSPGNYGKAQPGPNAPIEDNQKSKDATQDAPKPSQGYFAYPEKKN